ncbi:sensor histidine kinase [Dactylosporangium vinaceum]|uniref:Anti-sigma factor RsbA family regulatory protein n=1 Tax=Dactylosporangium vinaceum TaxID=53362 RepID=A0ABV5LY46_9ACTN|nr:anti-sigma factor RsbA family regulatory protein [Dactylosporangium vinaceum]UAC00988.1 sensor histidine kinase [Dactylosporangium vinaceum]
MRTGAGAGHTGYLHEAICYDSDEHLLDVVVPFLLGGVAAGEPTMVSFGERNAGLVRTALPPGCPVTYLTGGEVYARPAGAIRSYRTLLAEHVQRGAGQIRIVGELGRPQFGPTWDWWARYESAINHAYDEFPLWSMCAYDTRATPAHVLADVLRTHPKTAGPFDRHTANAQYTDPETFLLENRPEVADPLQRATPASDTLDGQPGESRRIVREAGAGRVGPAKLDDLTLAVSEIVANAHRYGRPPVRMRVWAGPGRVVVTVTDTGPGPKDPFAGLLPAASETSAGFGLWIAHQVCDHVSMQRGPDGFSIRLTVSDQTG